MKVTPLSFNGGSHKGKPHMQLPCVPQTKQRARQLHCVPQTHTHMNKYSSYIQGISHFSTQNNICLVFVKTKHITEFDTSPQTYDD